MTRRNLAWEVVEDACSWVVAVVALAVIATIIAFGVLKRRKEDRDQL